MTNTEPARNELGLRQTRDLTGLKKRYGSTYKFSTPEERRTRLEWQRLVAATSCCRWAYFADAVTLSSKVADEEGLPYACPERCESWQTLHKVIS